MGSSGRAAGDTMMSPDEELLAGAYAEGVTPPAPTPTPSTREVYLPDPSAGESPHERTHTHTHTHTHTQAHTQAHTQTHTHTHSHMRRDACTYTASAYFSKFQHCELIEYVPILSQPHKVHCICGSYSLKLCTLHARSTIITWPGCAVVWRFLSRDRSHRTVGD